MFELIDDSHSQQFLLQAKLNQTSIPVGYRVQGLKSAYSPPTPGLFMQGAETEWAWIEIPIKLDVTDEAILRFEYVFDPTVNAWLLQRTSMLAPESVKLPWLVF